MKKVFPSKLKVGDEVRVIAPSQSISIISPQTRAIAKKRLDELSLKLSFGKHVEECDEFTSSSIKSRLEDFNEAFADKKVRAVMAVIGGFNCNQLLRYIDWKRVSKNPKVFCGYSDTTALNNAIFAKTGLITYSGPSYSNFGQKLYFEYTLNYFKKCVMANDPFEVKPTDKWTDDKWYLNQDDRQPITNKGFLVINKGQAEGTILGSNLCTFNLLQGTEFMPNLTDSVLFLEDDCESNPKLFDRDLVSLIQQKGFDSVGGILIGRFQKESKMTDELLVKIIKTKKELDKIPVIANVDFGHTDPRITFPIGGNCQIEASKNPKIEILEH